MTTLAIVPAIEKAITPKPTKTELVQALTTLRIKQLREEQSEAIKRRDALKPKAEAALIKHFRQTEKTARVNLSLGYGSRENIMAGVCVRVDLDNVPDDVKKLLTDYHASTSIPCIPTEAEIRREIRGEMEGITPKSSRVETLLSSPDSRKALEDTLVFLGMGPKTKTLEA